MISANRGIYATLPDAGCIVDDASIVRDVDAEIRAWRERVLQFLLSFASIALAIPLLAVLTGKGLALPWSLRTLFALIYLLLLTSTLWRRGPFAFRVGMLLGLIGLMGALRLMVGRLEGSGRITLLLLPFMALLLAGPRAGWASVVLASALFALVPASFHFGWLSNAGVTWAHSDWPLPYWGLQGVFWLIVMLTLMILFTRFHALLHSKMKAEYLARRQLEAETADRQRLEAAIVRIDEEERQRLGAELHDGACQQLTAALLNCAALEGRWKAEGQPHVESLSLVRATIEDSIGMVHDVAKGLCPLDIKPDALLPALERLCSEARERHGIACELRADRSLVIQSPDQAMHLYRIAREAVANAIKHAKGSRIEIVLEQTEGELTLCISDNGPNTKPDCIPTAGLGLNILKHRARLIGAYLEVKGGPRGGMQVVCRLPRANVSS